MLDGLDNLALRLVQENDITVLAHDFDHEGDLNLVANFVFIGNGQLKNPVILYLLQVFDDSPLQVFSHNHGVGVGILRILKLGLGHLNSTKDRVGR